MQIFVHILGWIGTALILFAYYLVSNKKMEGSSPAYQWMNLVGAVGLGTNVFYLQAWPAVALEVIWALIAVIALFKFRKTN